MNTDNRETLKVLVELAKKATPGPWTTIGSAKRTLFTTAQGQQQVAPNKAFLPVEIVTCLRHAEQAHADCDFIQAARNAIPALEALLQPSSSAMAAARAVQDAFKAKLSEDVKRVAGYNVGTYIIPLEEIAAIISQHMQIPEGQWRPIESAPKDGKSILLVGGEYESDGGGSGYTHSYLLDIAQIGYWKDGWCLGYGETYNEEIWAKPTHWMPLPAPPKGDEG